MSVLCECGCVCVCECIRAPLDEEDVRHPGGGGESLSRSRVPETDCPFEQ